MSRMSEFGLYNKGDPKKYWKYIIVCQIYYRPYKTPVAPEVLVSRCITENQHIAKHIALPISTRTNGGILTKFITSFR
jgi:hypothetical protein